MADAQRPLPQPTPETQHYWDGAKAGELRLQTCSSCDHTYFPPRPFCPSCGSRDVAVTKASGKGTLHSYVIHHRELPGFSAPYAIAVVELAEGPRLMTNIVGCEPSEVEIGMPVEVDFADDFADKDATDLGEAGGSFAVPRFRPI